MTETRPLASRFRESLYRGTGLASLHAYIRKWEPPPYLYPMLYRLSPVLLAKIRYRIEGGGWLALDRPRTFDEKLFWLMLYWRHPLKTQCADKFEMRPYVESLGYGRLLVPLLGVYERSSDIDFGALPDQFVLKCTHGCGFNLICRDKKDLDIEATRRQLDAWMKVDYAKVNGEVQYAQIQPRITCERFLDGGNGSLPADFKLHCFHGHLQFTTVCTGRGADGHGAAYDHYDRDWQKQAAISRSGVHPERWSGPPDCYAEMLEAAEALSRPFPYVRMDFYAVRGQALLGEMTFTPAGCIDTGYTDEAQAYLGGLIQLPERLTRP
ncbi:glycosyl transferase [Geothrix limicola]|uniref:Glycosyl transferase n=1 Tax=Geothrix limicola TaxID=2927978 RepID=A0ABQ5QI13_9BACT|nr:ATP-grasp fold amidoligase family protein [Geothrix limicola]GLH74191.1 glycosyl transferase [Geothrix limicola]